MSEYKPKFSPTAPRGVCIYCDREIVMTPRRRYTWTHIDGKQHGHIPVVRREPKGK